MAKKDKAALAPTATAAAPKLTMMSFFSKAPPQSAAASSPKEKHQVSLPANQAVNISSKGNDSVSVMDKADGRSDNTPQRPPPPSASPAKDSNDGTTGENCQSGLSGAVGSKVVNLTLGKFDDVGKDDDDDCVIMSDPEDHQKVEKQQVSHDARDGVENKTPKIASASKAAKPSSASKAAGVKAAAGASKVSIDSKVSSKKGPVDVAVPAASAVNSIKQAFSSCTSYFKPAEKKEVKIRERPQHPLGSPIFADEELLMVSQFASTFSEVLGIEALSAQDLERDMRKPHPSEGLSALHVAMLMSIAKASDTPDEVRMIDKDTWPAVLLEHLEDSKAADCASVCEILGSFEYAFVTPEQRLKTLCLLVDDCLQTPLIRDYVDGSLAQIESYLREQQLEELGDKYQKKTQDGPGLSAFVVADPEPGVGPDAGDSAIMTERQRDLVRQREETARVQRVQDEKRQKEQRKLEEEEERKKAEVLKIKRIEDRARGLVVCGDALRVPTVWVGETDSKMGYLVMDCWGKGERQLLCRREEGETVTWSAIDPGNETDVLMEHWSPLYSEKERGFQKRLRDILPPHVPIATVATESHPVNDVAAICCDSPDQKEPGDEVDDGMGRRCAEDGTSECEAMAVDGQAESKIEEESAAQEEACEDPVAQAVSRCKQVLLDLELRTPDPLFADHNVWRGKRFEWIASVDEAEDVAGLAAAMLSYETQLKRAKMVEGWDEVRIKWMRDGSAAKTCATVNLLVKLLKVYIGKEKPRPGKLAAVFNSVPPRLTRSMLCEGEEVRRSARKRVVRYKDDDLDQEDDEDEGAISSGGSVPSEGESDFEPVADDEEAVGGRARGGGGGKRASAPSRRKSQRVNQGQRSVQKEQRAAPEVRPTRSTRASARAPVSYRADDASASDSE